jgi:hypothetical protein
VAELSAPGKGQLQGALNENAPCLTFIGIRANYLKHFHPLFNITIVVDMRKCSLIKDFYNGSALPTAHIKFTRAGIRKY